MENRIDYVAILEHTEQVGFDQSQTFTEVKILSGEMTVKNIIEWGKQYMAKPEIKIVQGL